ncbi:N-acetylglucosamine-6-phosphate deacetylase [Thorsellia anophelis]|uniref:N-acetylglucosamine-6-phosphate deacetylase n=1 Tax=Thorsellia anophelis DSM 18579 TaxID=1123402 RepID=A0A1H9Z9X2_9GAMM|nr:N-acetylglucosamine-6-phosphate deacetylase [Thorsellia anophelis]SES78344.1 N-acetylglucosamine-6-phosphate deacetylase [Thorsellia anophelis DSM 18579]
MFALVNAKIYTGDRLHSTPYLNDFAVIVDGNNIKALCQVKDLPAGINQIDLKGQNLAPGLIDLQLNGCGGVQFNDDPEQITEKTLDVMQTTNERFGCTSYLPTLITSDNHLMNLAVKTMRAYLSQDDKQHRALGLHLEGPYLSLAKKGTHDANLIRPADEEMITFLCNNADVIKMITLAPEQVNPDVITRLSQAGIIVSAGHSNSTYQEAKIGFAAGVSCATHLFNAMPYVTGREPGLVGALFDTPEIYAGIIVDGHHVAWSNVRLAKQMKADKLVLVTDATAPAGTEMETFHFAGKTIYHRDGACLDENGTLSGSAATLIKCVENSVEKVGIPLDEAIRMATLYPAKAIRVDDRLGSIEAGKIANLMVFNDAYEVTQTIVAGKLD